MFHRPVGVMTAGLGSPPQHELSGVAHPVSEEPARLRAVASVVRQESDTCRPEARRNVPGAASGFAFFRPSSGNFVGVHNYVS